ncbi:SRPBCC family protein [Streptomyces sp. NPDC001985]|uniref:SRPBCC family protein n=1 Tax=Streptomyces sp. NPDC001985 TaxID=3154406 RepID=UPI0033215F3F
MWTYEHTITTSATPEAVWACYEDPARWPEWDREVRELILDRPFAAGAGGTLHLHELPPIPIRVTEAERLSGFRTETRMADGTVIRFAHRLAGEAGGATRITHGVEIEGPSAGDAFGTTVAAPVPGTMRKLADVARAGDR